MIFKDCVPDRVRVFLCLFFAVVFQFSGGIYLSSVSQMVGATALMQEDIMMAGYASFVGMTLVFPVLFRLKFRFTTRSILLFICPALILCNLVTMNTGSLPVLVFFCFAAGILRMWGTFEALSNVQLSITPTRDFRVFFPVVYMIVLGSIQLSGLTTVHLGYHADWRYMHLLITGLLLVVWAVSLLLTRHFRPMKPMPLYGIDWLGGILWAVFLLSLIFVFEYGKYYDWYYSPQITAATAVAAVSLALSIHRMIAVRHPYISPQAFRYRNLTLLLVLFLALCVLLASPNVLQNAYVSSILGFDMLNIVSLNWWNFAGTAAGCIFAYIWHAKLHRGYRPAVFAGFALIVGYQCFMYFIVTPDMNIEWLYLPTLLRGAGYIILYISMTVYVTQIVPFEHFFQVLSLLGFVRTGFGSVMGSALYSAGLQHIVPDNFQNISSSLDMVNTAVTPEGFAQVYAEAMKQAVLVSVKEMYGGITIAGLLFLCILLLGVIRPFRI